MSVPAGRRPFHCRERALGKLRRWLDARWAGVLVTGGPGAGKTALCAQAVRPTTDAGSGAGLAARCLASHFCRREDERSLAVWRFVLGLVEALRGSALLPAGYARTLDTPTVTAALDPLHCQRDPDDTFKSHQHLFPDWLLLVCSVRRQNRAVCRMFSGFRKLALDDLRKAWAVRDVQQYILRRLDQEGALRSQLTPETAEMLNLLHIKSGGCFLFLERVLDGVGRGLVAVREIRHIPGTLNGLYLWLCQRLFPKRLFARVRPLLNALLASPRPLAPALLFRAVWTREPALEPAEFARRLDALAPLLTEGEGGARFLFHASFAEWLTDVKYCTQRYLCSAAEGHSMLAMSLSLRAPRLGTEETCQLANHLLRSGVHASDPALLALWMVWAGVPALATPPSCPPVLVRPDAFRLLQKSGALSPACGVHCVEGGGPGGALGGALEGAESVQLLLDSGASVNRADPRDGRTLLAGAAHAGATAAVEVLLSRGADPELQDGQGQSALTLAVRQGHLGVVRALLDWAGRGGRPRGHAGTRGRRGLDPAEAGGLGATGAVELLLEAGPRWTRATERAGPLRAAAWAGHEEIVSALLAHGAQPDRADREGRTPLIAAAYMGHRGALEALLERGASVDLRDAGGRTALSVACGAGRAEVVGALLDRGANPNQRDGDGLSPLLLAAYEGQADVMELLLEAGADVDQSSAPGPAPGALTPLLAAASMGHGPAVSTALFWGAAADAIDGEGRTALSLAAGRGSVGVVRALLDRGLDESHRDDLGWTPLHAGAWGPPGRVRRADGGEGRRGPAGR
ncbi:hypothetical protein AAFF_G00132580 [Aldrovandia affinis]|uniref:Ankyrin repeat domain-containing protein 50 n=1 Tax=Aldrovandia affinis TaxID=143900 RepID=A0AAD7WA68_9TELE|nr:hypothetical protein AAFF_G00132580 [Aldrovandia affinis]